LKAAKFKQSFRFPVASYQFLSSGNRQLVTGNFCYSSRPMALFTKDAPAAAPRPQPPRSTDAQPSFQGTFFGPKASVEGMVTGSESVMIEGHMKGTINLTGELHIGTQARVEAKVHARNVTIEGKVNGDISADERVELVASANVDGNIKAPKIIVAEGARFRGNVDMGAVKPSTHSENAGVKK